ncbi:MAG: ankyrin repeat domain-containing protein, partial [Synergistaceae bacterium]|nr:ankyrin repeat domain-containing protein [Synergistaceae bacterium]
EDCVMCNTVFEYETEISGKLLEEMNNAELPPRIEPLPLPEKIEAKPVTALEVPKPEPLKPVVPEPEPTVQETSPPPKRKRPPMRDDVFLELCRSGDAEKIEEAITDNGANINAKGKDGRTPLIEATYSGKAGAVEVLLQYGADVHEKDNEGRTALMSANNAEVAEVLWEYGADINPQDLINAADKGYSDVAECFLKHGVHIADINAALLKSVSEERIKLAEFLLKHEADVNAKNNKGNTALMMAAEKGRAKVVEVLLKHGADINAKNNGGDTALWLAADKGYSEVAELLMKNGADADVNAALIDATLRKSKQAAEFFRTHGADVKVAEIAEFLRNNHAADVKAKNNDGETALVWAAKKGYAEVAELLLKHGAGVNAKDKQGYTALMRAAKKGHADVAKLLRNPPKPEKPKRGLFGFLFG